MVVAILVSERVLEWSLFGSSLCHSVRCRSSMSTQGEEQGLQRALHHNGHANMNIRRWERETESPRKCCMHGKVPRLSADRQGTLRVLSHGHPNSTHFHLQISHQKPTRVVRRRWPCDAAQSRAKQRFLDHLKCPWTWRTTMYTDAEKRERTNTYWSRRTRHLHVLQENWSALFNEVRQETHRQQVPAHLPESRRTLTSVMSTTRTVTPIPSRSRMAKKNVARGSGQWTTCTLARARQVRTVASSEPVHHCLLQHPQHDVHCGWKRLRDVFWTVGPPTAIHQHGRKLDMWRRHKLLVTCSLDGLGGSCAWSWTRAWQTYNANCARHRHVSDTFPSLWHSCWDDTADTSYLSTSASHQLLLISLKTCALLGKLRELHVELRTLLLPLWPCSEHANYCRHLFFRVFTTFSNLPDELPREDLFGPPAFESIFWMRHKICWGSFLKVFVRNEKKEKRKRASLKTSVHLEKWWYAL